MMIGTEIRAAIENVLFATDFTEEAISAIQYADALRQYYKAHLYVVHVLDLFPFALSGDATARARVEAIRAQAERKMEEFLRIHHLRQQGVESALVSGEVFTAINRFVEEHEIDLIVLGSHGDAGLSRLFQGSTAEEIFRTAHCPVMVVGPKAGESISSSGFSRILFATDLTESARLAVPYLEFLLDENAAARVTLAHFLDENCNEVYQRHRLRRNAEHELRELLSPGYRSQIEDVVVEFSPPAQGMLEAARGCRADLLFLAVRYGGAFLRAATHGLFSTAPQVIAQAPCPVLTVRTA